jgi:hypothetical protein
VLPGWSFKLQVYDVISVIAPLGLAWGLHHFCLKNRFSLTRRSLKDNSIRSGRAVLSKAWPVVLDRISYTTSAFIPAFEFHLGRGYVLLCEGLTLGAFIVGDVFISVTNLIIRKDGNMPHCPKT